MGRGRLTGAAPYGAAALLLAAGAAWWVAAAPESAKADPRVRGWAAAVLRSLPDDDVTGAETALLEPGGERRWDLDVSIGQFEIRMVCAGVGEVRVWVGAPDSGRAYSVACGDEPVPHAAVLGAAGGFRVQVNPASGGPSVVRWQLVRIDY